MADVRSGRVEMSDRSGRVAVSPPGRFRSKEKLHVGSRQNVAPLMCGFLSKKNVPRMYGKIWYASGPGIPTKPSILEEDEACFNNAKSR